MKPFSLRGDLSGGKLVRARPVSAQPVVNHCFGQTRMFAMPHLHAEQGDLVWGLPTDLSQASIKIIGRADLDQTVPPLLLHGVDETR